MNSKLKKFKLTLREMRERERKNLRENKTTTKLHPLELTQ